MRSRRRAIRMRPLAAIASSTETASTEAIAAATATNANASSIERNNISAHASISYAIAVCKPGRGSVAAAWRDPGRVPDAAVRTATVRRPRSVHRLRRQRDRGMFPRRLPGEGFASNCV